MCDIFSKFEKLSKNDTETMGLKTGGRSAVPTKENEERSRLAILAEKMRRTEEERDEDIRSVKHEADQNDLNLKLSMRHSKIETIETEKKPMMAPEDERHEKTNGEGKNRKRKRTIHLEKDDFIDGDEVEISPESEEERKWDEFEEELDEAVRRKTRGGTEYEPTHPYCDDQEILDKIFQILERCPKKWEHFLSLTSDGPLGEDLFPNDSITKKVQKKSKSPNKNHTRNLSRRRIQKPLQNKIRPNNNPKKSKTRPKRTPKHTPKENDLATKKTQKSSKFNNKNHARNLCRRRTRRHYQKKIRVKNNQTKKKTHLKRTIAIQDDTTYSLSRIQKKKKPTIIVNEQRMKRNRRFKCICEKWWFRWWSRWKFRWRLLWWTYRTREKQPFGTIWNSINFPFRSQKR